MKRLLALLLLLSPMALAQVRPIAGNCTTGNQQVTISGLLSTTRSMASYPKCVVTVYLHGTATLATIYADALDTPLASTFTANANGSWQFYADPSTTYDIVMSGGLNGGFLNPVTLSDVAPVAPPLPVVNIDQVPGIDCTGTNNSYTALQSLFNSGITGKALVGGATCKIRVQAQLTVTAATNFVIAGTVKPSDTSTGFTIFGCGGAAGPLIKMNRVRDIIIDKVTIAPAGANCTSNFTAALMIDNDPAGGGGTTTHGRISDSYFPPSLAVGANGFCGINNGTQGGITPTDGSQMGYCNTDTADTALYQTAVATIATGHTYVLSVDVGWRNDNLQPSCTLDLMANSAIAATSGVLALTQGSFLTKTLTLVAGAGINGQSLGIRLRNTYDVALQTRQCDFDKVTLTDNGAPVTVSNFSFETPALGAGQFSTSYPPSWIGNANSAFIGVQVCQFGQDNCEDFIFERNKFSGGSLPNSVGLFMPNTHSDKTEINHNDFQYALACYSGAAGFTANVNNFNGCGSYSVFGSQNGGGAYFISGCAAGTLNFNDDEASEQSGQYINSADDTGAGPGCPVYNIKGARVGSDTIGGNNLPPSRFLINPYPNSAVNVTGGYFRLGGQQAGTRYGKYIVGGDFSNAATVGFQAKIHVDETAVVADPFVNGVQIAEHNWVFGYSDNWTNGSGGGSTNTASVTGFRLCSNYVASAAPQSSCVDLASIPTLTGAGYNSNNFLIAPVNSDGSMNNTSILGLGYAVSGLQTAPMLTTTIFNLRAVGATGATSYTYKIVAYNATGSITSAGATIANGNATLTTTNYNQFQWRYVPGAVAFDIYRTAGGATQGKIGTQSAAAFATTASGQLVFNDNAITFADTGLVGDGGTPPAASTADGRICQGAACWITGAGAPAGACANGSLYTDSAAGKLYVCEATVWAAK